MIMRKKILLTVLTTAALLVISSAASAQCVRNPTGETSVGLKNASSHFLTLFIDGTNQGGVPTGDRSVDFIVTPGLHALVAQASIGGETVSASRDVIVPVGRVCTWTVTDPPPRPSAADARQQHALSAGSLMSVLSVWFSQETDPYKVTASQPPSMADAPLEFQVVSQRKMINGAYKYAGWTPVISGRMLGRTRKGDAVMVELAQDGKLIHTLRAGLKGTGGETWYEDWEIRGDDTKDLLTTVGKLTATFKYYSDTDEKTAPLTVRQFQVVKLADYDEGKSIWKYGALYDDLLGFSYVVQRQPTSGELAGVWIYTWMNLQHDSAIKDISYKLSVNGNPVVLDDAFDANQNHESIVTLGQQEAVFVKAKNDRVINPHNVYLVVFRPKLLWGSKGSAAGPGWLSLADHPGRWIFRIRIAGQVVRELHFTVLPNGQIAPHPEQDTSKAGFLNLGPGRFFVETYFPSPNTFDLRFNPEAVRSGTLYGRAWISNEVIGGMLKTLPPKNPGTMPFPQPALPGM